MKTLLLVLFLVLPSAALSSSLECSKYFKKYMAYSLKDIAFERSSAEVFSEGREKVDCYAIVRELDKKSKSISDDYTKCLNGKISPEDFRILSEVPKEDPFVLDDNNYDESQKCAKQGDQIKVDSFKKTHQELMGIKSGTMDLNEWCKIATDNYKASEKKRINMFKSCTDAGASSSCQIADANGNCPGSPEAAAFEKQRTAPQPQTIGGAETIGSRIQRIRSDKEKCLSGDFSACARTKSRGATSIGK